MSHVLAAKEKELKKNYITQTHTLTSHTLTKQPIDSRLDSLIF